MLKLCLKITVLNIGCLDWAAPTKSDFDSCTAQQF